MNRRTTLAATLTAGLATLALPIDASASPVTPTDPPAGFTQGTWEGQFVLSGRVDAPGRGTGFTQGKGGFTVQALPADISGDFSYEWTTDYHITAPDLPDALRDGRGTGSVSGSVVDSTTGPLLYVESMNVLDVELDPSLALSPRLDITVSTCTTVSGDWTAEFLDQAAATSVLLSGVTGRFVAQRSENVPADLADQFRLENETMLAEMAQLRAEVIAGDASAVDRLPGLLQRAEAVGRNRVVEASCLTTARTEMILHPMVDELVRMYATGEITLDGSIAAELVVAALRAGVVGAGALDPALAHARLLDLRDALARDIAATTAVEYLVPLALAAQSLGMRDLADLAFASIRGA